MKNIFKTCRGVRCNLNLKKLFILSFFAFAFFGFTTQVSAATNVFYSVGQNTSDHKTGSPTVTVSGTTATFSIAQTATNMGVGDAVTYGGITAYISAKQSTSVWNLITPTGVLPTATTSAPVTSISHAYSSLESAITGASDANHMATSSLLAAPSGGDFILNIPCYYDTGPDTTAVNVTGYTTGASNYIKIYTPNNTSTEVNQSQRHNGSWDSLAYQLTPSLITTAIDDRINNLKVDGLQILTKSTGFGIGGDVDPADNVWISNNLIQLSSSYDSANYHFGIRNQYNTSTASKAYVWNNVIYNFSGNDHNRGILGNSNPAVAQMYFYNNTLYNNYIGISTDSTLVVTAKNNIIQQSAVDRSYAGVFSASSTNNISDYTDAPGSNPQNSTLVAFVDLENNDFHLAPGDTAAKGQGVDLSADANLAFNADIDGDTRTDSWDIGADQDVYIPTDYISPTITNFTLPATAVSLTVPVTTFTATDNVGVTGYLITESAAPPSLGNLRWSNTAPTSFIFSGAGVRDAYSWVKDYDGNISSSSHQSVTISFAGTSYYVDATSGDDANLGTSLDQAWQTIAKVNAATFQPADKILFKRGEIWRETLTIPSSGVENAPIIFGAYGTGADPIISGADIVNGWTNYSGNIYVADVALDNIPTQLYTDGTFQDIARYPNSDWLSATANSTDTTSVIDTNLDLPFDQIIGATVLVKPNSWAITTLTAVAYDISTHKITLSGNVYGDTTKIKTGWGFYLQSNSNNASTLPLLDAPGEWYYDATAHKIYLWMPGNSDPTGHTIEISNRSYGVNDIGKNYITINNLSVNNANQQNVYVSETSNVTIDGLSTSGGQNSIYLNNTSNSLVKDNSVQNTLSDGIHGYQENNDTLLNNTINNAGYTGTSPKTSSGGIFFSSGLYVIVSGNTITNSGYNGIGFSGSHNLIENNIINESCLTLDDCGGIYTYTASIVSNYTSNTITNNKITDVIGNETGTPNTSTRARGIYLDGFTQYATVTGNTISNADLCVYVRGHNNTVQHNVFFGARLLGLGIDDLNNPSGVYDDLIANNIFESVSTDATVKISGNYTNIGSTFGVIDYNHYYHPNSVNTVTNKVIGQSTNYTLPYWQNTYGNDTHSFSTSEGFTDYMNNDFTLTSKSPAIDAGTGVGLTTDYDGNPIYGRPDIGAYEYQPPYTIGTNNIPTTGSIRIYSDGKYRMKTATSTSATASFSVTPVGGNYLATTTQFMDITLNTWTATEKSWTATSTTSAFMTHATSTVYTIGDLTPSTVYSFDLDGSPSTAITGTTCSGNVCTSDSSGSLTFTYTGGYSTHTFDLVTQPTLSGNTGVVFHGSHTVTLSGGTTIRYTTDGATPTCTTGTLYTAPITFSNSTTLTAVSCDSAGNSSVITTATYSPASGGGAGGYWRSTHTGVATPPLEDSGLQSASTTTAISSSESGSQTSTPLDAPSADNATAHSSAPHIALSATQIQSILSVLTSFGVDQATLDSVNAALNGAPVTSTSTQFATFTRNLSLYKTGPDVKALQHFLNMHGFTVSMLGDGSSGHETKFFGVLTQQALIKYQKAHNITPAVGFFGPITRASVGAF